VCQHSDGQHSQMLIMLQARRAGDETTVHRVLTEYREQRCRRRPKSDVPPATDTEKTEHKAKRRRSVTANRHEDYCYMFPQVSDVTLLHTYLREYGIWRLSLAASQYRLTKTLKKVR
jgi:2-C-methyl-D-erythritol 4-phosphate cytidylyltransferase